MPFLSQIFIYPIKSLAGIQLDQWEVTRSGLKYDRKWMLVDEQQQFLSQRRLPKMALIKTRIIDQQLVVSAPDQTDLKLGLEPPVTDTIQEVTIWHDQCAAQKINQQASQWFSDFLKFPCSLVYQPNENIRTVDQKYALANDQTSFSDGFPFLIVAAASLELLNQQMNLTLSMRRFRPNLVISDCTAYAEDIWRKISIGEISFRLPKPCSRCSVPQIDPDTALTGKEPLQTLARTRKWDNQVFFGQNALHDNPGILHTGDQVIINATGPAQPPLEH
ncbi:oxidoreductase [Methyloprofundus sedimenti]|uniref:Oxidoreductase n=1 Tax=Methyloprofundus sedimenti TaxID=1420851 RepID=A0A1V8M2X1_9GAMM|nr:MOSC N-terminal beta barrel domain-containing protein [Methyloprofundus sedimenti]OQK15894.1 oxidoreductase [Methyloprofundus sedimenti]